MERLVEAFELRAKADNEGTQEETMALKWRVIFKDDKQEIRTATDESKPGTTYTITHTSNAKPQFRLHCEKRSARSPLGGADSWEEAEKFADDHAKNTVV
jgi:hypothetical protein